LVSALAFLGSVGHVLDYAQQAQEQQKKLALEKMKLQQAAAEFQFTQQQLQLQGWADKASLASSLAKIQQDSQPRQQSTPYDVAQAPGQGGAQPAPAQGGPTLPGAQMIGAPGNAGLPGGTPSGMSPGPLAGPLPPQSGAGAAPAQPGASSGFPPPPSLQSLTQEIAEVAPPGTPPQAIMMAARQAMPAQRQEWEDKLKVYQAQQLVARESRSLDERTRHDYAEEAQGGQRIVIAGENAGAKGWQFLTGQDGKMYRANVATGKVEPVDDAPAGLSKLGAGGQVGQAKATPDAIYDAAREYRETSKMPLLGLNSGGVRTQILNEAARQRRLEKVTVEADIAHAAGVTADSRSLNNLQKQADAAESFEATAKKNFELALSLAPKGVPTNLGPFINKWVQGGAIALGDKNIPPYIAALLTGADEYAKVMSGSTGAQGSTVDSRRVAAELFSGAYNVDQIRNVIEGVAYKDMDNRTQSYAEKLDAIKQRIQASPAGDETPKPPVKISSDADYNALPSGAEFIAPDGSHRKKP
jgi:hypothetical protein